MEYQSLLIFKLLCLSLKWVNNDLFLEKVYIQKTCFEISNLTWKSKWWVGPQEIGTKNQFFWQMGALLDLKVIKVKDTVEACVGYFIFHQMIALNNYQKSFLFHLKSSFCSRAIQIFVFPSSPLFFPAGHCFRRWLKINLKVYNVINCLNKNSMTYFVWYLQKERRYDIETLSIDGVLNKKYSYGKIMQKICPKS